MSDSSFREDAEWLVLLKLFWETRPRAALSHISEAYGKPDEFLDSVIQRSEQRFGIWILARYAVTEGSDRTEYVSGPEAAALARLGLKTTVASDVSFSKEGKDLIRWLRVYLGLLDQRIEEFVSFEALERELELHRLTFVPSIFDAALIHSEGKEPDVFHQLAAEDGPDQVLISHPRPPVDLRKRSRIRKTESMRPGYAIRTDSEPTPLEMHLLKKRKWRLDEELKRLREKAGKNPIC